MRCIYTHGIGAQPGRETAHGAVIQMEVLRKPGEHSSKATQQEQQQHLQDMQMKSWRELLRPSSIHKAIT
jgi:hypothetical protein